MTLYFIRHGAKEKGDFFNEGLGHRDPPLSAEGRAQASSLSSFFRAGAVSALYASEYLRARETAEFLSAALALPFSVDRRLNEIDNGVVECMTEDEIERSYPEFWRDYRSHETDYRFPGGETGAEVQARQRDLLAELAGIGRDAALVCHEGYIRSLACTVLGMPVYWRYKFKYDFCGITELEYEAGKGEWYLRRFGQITWVR